MIEIGILGSIFLGLGINLNAFGFDEVKEIARNKPSIALFENQSKMEIMDICDPLPVNLLYILQFIGAHHFEMDYLRTGNQV